MLDEINNLNTSQIQSQDLMDSEENPEHIIRAMDNTESTSDGLRNRRSGFVRTNLDQNTIEGNYR